MLTGSETERDSRKEKKKLEWAVVHTVHKKSVIIEISSATLPKGNKIFSLCLNKELPNGYPSKFFHPKDVIDLVDAIELAETWLKENSEAFA